MSFCLMKSQMIRVISYPSISTTGFSTLIFAISVSSAPDSVATGYSWKHSGRPEGMRRYTATLDRHLHNLNRDPPMSRRGGRLFGSVAWSRCGSVSWLLCVFSPCPAVWGRSTPRHSTRWRPNARGRWPFCLFHAHPTGAGVSWHRRAGGPAGSCGRSTARPSRQGATCPATHRTLARCAGDRRQQTPCRAPWPLRWQRSCFRSSGPPRSARGSAASPRRLGHPLFDVARDLADHLFHVGVLEEMPRALDLGMGDGDALLLVQLAHERMGVLRRRHPVGGAVDDEARRRAGGEEGEIVHVRRRRDRDEAGDLGPPHQKLHPDPGSEGEARDPAML